MNPALRSQSRLPTTSSNFYQDNSTPVASSNRQSPTLFGTSLSQSYQPNDETLAPSAGYKMPNVEQEVITGQSDSSSRLTMIAFNDASIIPMLGDLKLQSLTDLF